MNVRQVMDNRIAHKQRVELRTAIFVESLILVTTLVVTLWVKGWL